MNGDTATISFKDDARDSAGHFYRQTEGWTVEVYPTGGIVLFSFTATVGELSTGDDGQLKITMHRCSEETSNTWVGEPAYFPTNVRIGRNGCLSDGDKITLDIYEDIDQIVVC